MSAPWQYEKDRLFAKRLVLLLILFIFIISILIGRVFYLQIIQGEKYKELADKNRISSRLTLPSRGYIYDRNGVKLAENKKTFQAVLIKEQSNNIKQTLDNFEKIIPLEENEKKRIEREIKRKRAYMPIHIKDGLGFEEAAKIQLNAPFLKGIEIEEEITRFYPQDEKTAHLIGYVSLLNERDLIKNPDSPLGDLPGYRIGRSGVEYSFEEILQGEPGIRNTEINAYGHSVRILEEEEAKKGENITLTVDARLQEFALKAMNNEAGSVIVMNVKTGEILALISSPSFDPNIFTVPISTKNWNTLIKNEKRPLQNKALTGTYSPGSIFKLVVALAGLESGHITRNKKVYCSGKTKVGNHDFHCWKHSGHGKLTIEEALMHSCDVYFYEIARELGEEKILEMAKKLGFGSAIGIGIKGERTGLLPSGEWKKKRFKDEWRLGDTINLSIGQGFLNATPMQLVHLVALISNGGIKIKPHLIKKDVEDAAPEKLNISPYSLRLVRNGMNNVVNNKEGTAFRSRFNLNGQKMAGKTASIQVRRISKKERETGVIKQEKLPWKYRDHAMFVAYAPVEKPRFAIIVAVEHGGGGSTSAAPIASKIMQEVLRLYPDKKKGDN